MCGFISHVFLIHSFYKEQFHWKYLLFKGLLEAQPESPKESEVDVPSICSVLTLAPMSSELYFCYGKTSNCSSTKVCGRLLLFVNERERYQFATSTQACFQLQFKMEKSYLHTLFKRCDDAAALLRWDWLSVVAVGCSCCAARCCCCYCRSAPGPRSYLPEMRSSSKCRSGTKHFFMIHQSSQMELKLAATSSETPLKGISA